MNNRNAPMIATGVAAVLCGCPGLFGLCFGATTMLAGLTPNAEIDVFGRTDQASALAMGGLVLCLSVIAIAMPVIIWFVTRRRSSVEPVDNEPVPPAS
jgi:hypothetical protein